MRLFRMSFVAFAVCALAACGSNSSDNKQDIAPEIADDVVDAVPDIAPEDIPPVEDLQPDLLPDVVETIEEIDIQPQDVEDTQEEVDTLTWEYPDPTLVNKYTAEPLMSASDPYQADETYQYPCPSAIPGTRANVVKWVGDTLYVGTDAGLFKYIKESDWFEAVALVSGVSVVDVASQLTSNGLLFVATSESIVWFQPAGGVTGTLSIPEGGAAFTSVEVKGTDVIAGTQGLGAIRILLNEPPDWLPAGSAGGALAPSVRDIAFGPAGTILFATAQGVEVLAGDEVSFKKTADGLLPDDDVRSLFVDSAAGNVWAATATGVARIKGTTATMLLAGVGALPTDNNLSIYATNDMLVLGHAVGATVVESPFANDQPYARLDHYTSKRYLPDNQVLSVTVDGDQNVWLATAAGVARRFMKEHTFAEKEAYNQEMVEKHFWRMDGFVSSDAGLNDPAEYNADVAWRTWDKDNDGLWTQMQIGAWCYAYATTHDERYYEAARKAMNNMFMLVDLPGIDFENAGLGRGFISRSLVREDEGEVFSSKSTQDNWHLVEWQGKQYYWKDDTSSDEIDGHFYGFPLFYDLCAKTDEERAEVASYAAAVMTYIMDHGYKLIDLDGEKTTHGHWSPDTIGAAAIGVDECIAAAKGKPNTFELVEWCVDSYYGGGWLNGNEILGALLATWHMTKDQKFYDAYEILVQVHHYDNIIVPHDETLTVTNPSMMNHSDHELAMLAYQTILRYEPNAERRTKWVEGFKFFYDYELIERNPLWAGFAALVMETDPVQMGEALISLQEMPFDRREWAIDHSHRKDWTEWPLDRFDEPQTHNVYPYDEIRTIWWNGNLHAMTEGGNGLNVSGPLAWLLPYWALRYAGVISE